MLSYRMEDVMHAPLHIWQATKNNQKEFFIESKLTVSRKSAWLQLEKKDKRHIG